MTCMLCPPRVLKPAEVVLLTENTLVSVGNTILLTCIGGTMLMQAGYKLSPWCVQQTVFYSHHQLVQRWLPAGGCIEQEVSNSRGNGPGVSGPHSPAPEEHPHPCWTWWRQQELYQYSCMASNEIDTAILNQTYELTISRGKVLQNTKLQASKLYWPTYTLQPP